VLQCVVAVCHSVLQCVAVCSCSVLQCVAAGQKLSDEWHPSSSVLQCVVAMCCWRLLQYVSVCCCSVLQCAAAGQELSDGWHPSINVQYVSVCCCSVLQCAAAGQELSDGWHPSTNVLQCVVKMCCCSVLQCVAVRKELSDECHPSRSIHHVFFLCVRVFIKDETHQETCQLNDIEIAARKLTRRLGPLANPPSTQCVTACCRVSQCLALHLFRVHKRHVRWGGTSGPKLNVLIRDKISFVGVTH